MAEPAAIGEEAFVTFTSVAERDAAEATGQYAPGVVYVVRVLGTIVEAGYVDLTGAFVATGTGTGGVWTTQALLDLTGFTATDFKALGDGAHVVDGVTFNINFSANSASFALNANGLQVVSNAGTEISTVQFNAPLVSFDLSALVPSFDPLAHYRYELGWSDGGTRPGMPTGGFQAVNFGLWSGATPVAAALAAWLIDAHSPTVGPYALQNFKVGSSGYAFPAAGVLVGDRFYLDLYIQDNFVLSRVSGSTTAFSGFVAADTLAQVAQGDWPSTPNLIGPTSPHTGDFYGAGKQRLTIGTQRTGTAPAWTATYTDLRVQKFVTS